MDEDALQDSTEAPLPIEIQISTTMAIKRMYGIDLHSAIESPTAIEFDYDEELYAWFNERPESESTHTRIICVRLNNFSHSDSTLSKFDIPQPQSVIESAIWNPEVYANLVANPAGGASGLADEPWRFILQTPLDGGPFCSLAMSRKGNIVKGIYYFDDEDLDPIRIANGDSTHSAWRRGGMQIVTLPHKFLQVHSVALSQRLARAIARVRRVEMMLAASDQTPADVGSLSRILHSCNMELVDIERRSRFESSVIEAIETIVAASRHGTMPWPPLGPQRTALASRKFDFESLPRRIENARATITSLIQQRNEALNLELAQASHQIAEATLSDSRSMKTIAILTMVLLPGTAVASLFSMNMFNWSAADGGDIASKWLWIYFVVTIPLTGLTLALWWFWNRRSLQSAAQFGSSVGRGTGPFRDEEAGPAVAHSSDMDSEDAKPGNHS
jgi:hypothetical protein